MLERYYVRPVTVDRIRANVAGAYIEHYVEWMEAQGYSARSVFRRVPILCQFGDFASRHGATDGWAALEHVEPFVRHWQSVHGRSCKSDAARAKVAREARNPVRQMLELSLHGSVEPHRPRKPFPFEAEVPGFAGYLRDERGLKPASIRQYVHYLNGLQTFIERSHASVASLSPVLLAAFILDRCPGLSRSSRRDLCGTLHVFLRYCQRERVIGRDLSVAVQPPQVYIAWLSYRGPSPAPECRRSPTCVWVTSTSTGRCACGCTAKATSGAAARSGRRLLPYSGSWTRFDLATRRRRCSSQAGGSRLRALASTSSCAGIPRASFDVMQATSPRRSLRTAFGIQQRSSCSSAVPNPT